MVIVVSSIVIFLHLWVAGAPALTSFTSIEKDDNGREIMQAFGAQQKEVPDDEEAA